MWANRKRNRTSPFGRGWALGAAVAVACGVLVTAGAARSFVTEGPGMRPWSPIEDVLRTPRWSDAGGSLLETGDRGLGGGLEYTLDDSLCTGLRFVDAAPCEDVKAAVRAALDRWSSGHPSLRFLEVSDRQPVVPQGDASQHLGQGAEIDFFAESPERFPPFRQAAIAAMTNYYFDTERQPLLTNGQMGVAALGTLVAADVRFSTGACYYLDPSQARYGCAHFPSLVQHEIAHTLGIDHPDEDPGRNLDNDDDPRNPVLIDCQNPTAGLRVNPVVVGEAAAIGLLFGSGTWRRGPTNDDIAARDALYPHCGIVAMDRSAPPSWGGFAVAADGATMSVIGAPSEDAARTSLTDACLQTGRDCIEVRAFTQCFAFASDGRGRSAGAVGAFIGFAREQAISDCGDSTACRVTEAFCAFE